MKTFNHIVVPTDFSATARDALRMACAMAAGSAARISLIHVIADVWREPCVQREVEQQAIDRLSSLAAEAQRSGLTVRPVLMFGTAHAEVGRYIEAHGADLIIVGSHGLGLIRRFLLGSVADRLIRTAGCPVLLIPHESLCGTHASADETIPALAAADATDHASVDEQC